LDVLSTAAISVFNIPRHVIISKQHSSNKKDNIETEMFFTFDIS